MSIHQPEHEHFEIKDKKRWMKHDYVKGKVYIKY